MYSTVILGEWDVPDGIRLLVEVSEMFQMVPHCQRRLVRCSRWYPNVSGGE